MTFPPASANRSNILALTAGDAPQPQSSPKVMVPSATSESRTPDLPKSLYLKNLRRPSRTRRVVDQCCPTLARSCQCRQGWPAACLTNRVEELARLKDLILHIANGARTWTALTGVSVLCSPTTTEPLGDVTEPTVAVIAQGAKETALNRRNFAYGPGQFVITSLELPVAGHIVQAGAEEPFLAGALKLH